MVGELSDCRRRSFLQRLLFKPNGLRLEAGVCEVVRLWSGFSNL